MCWSCEMDRSSITAPGGFGAAGLGGGFARLTAHYQKAADTRYFYDATAFPADGVGDQVKDVSQTEADLAAAALITDEQPGDTSTDATLDVGGARAFSTLNTPGDQDFYKVELEAGETYEFGMYSTTSGPSGVTLTVAYLVM